MAKKSTKMNYGKGDSIKGDLDIKKSKIRITTMIDFDVYEALKADASSLNMGYQTLLNLILKEKYGTAPKSEIAAFYETFQEAMKEINERVSKIEKKTSKQKTA